jgi:hypothetical protein
MAFYFPAKKSCFIFFPVSPSLCLFSPRPLPKAGANIKLYLALIQTKKGQKIKFFSTFIK